ncbi:MAG: phosphate ABC transporter permease PstA [Trueperaceae bacterium]|nr:phosphate ABC transporter permease PstA [Trueperaceae bacterium]
MIGGGRGRLLRGRLFGAGALAAALLGLAVLAALLVDVALDTVSWQVVEPAGSGESFAFLDGFALAGSWERVVRLELAARGVNPEAADALLADREQRRLFAARNRVRLMWAVDGAPLRWVVSSSRDRLVRDEGLLAGARAYRELMAEAGPGRQLYLNPWLNPGFLRRLPSRTPLLAGVGPALAGSLWVIGLVALIAVPLGVGAAVYLEEYGGRSRAARLLEVNLRNLAGVPSVVYGILGLTVFVRLMRLGPVVLAAALTLALLVLPVVVVATREGLRAVPDSLRQAAYGLGAAKSQVVFKVVLPAARAGVVTGVILAVARAIGETAPLLIIGAAAFVPGVPSGPLSQFTVLPIQIYSWVGENDPEFAHLASAGIVVLLVVLALMYAVAARLRRALESRA